ncbi:hypothetical protein H8356DRAFT_1625373 [Neocallimastix lanati (nom. inval.)]|jgi:Ca2+-binding EF-hand superfamily protein|uniref:EF-hand domain-containing protein n=1 Tax=Neocallimastix californiae TaxID=1754190 RepID=A0A1Y2EUE6_9FUNG|nr:hypothetical protein H8356DRAFT_1625373 [Neocallimastix sp. JGI-2020a]ORY75202.1 hypothetical protein LY90DRAFT_665934 [Neocallimastix californiae]|eukprot:ORY75202.1 hypothetical protein LY90DRAFT_665934 [Neocallimastix californiae]
MQIHTVEQLEKLSLKELYEKQKEITQNEIQAICETDQKLASKIHISELVGMMVKVLDDESLFNVLDDSDFEKVTLSYVEDARNLVNEVQNEPSLETLSKATSLLFKALYVYPDNVAVYHLLAFISLIMNQFNIALDIAEMGQCIDETYEPLNELIEEINMILSQLEGNEDQEPLIENNNLSEGLRNALCNIYDKFDKDQDGLLNFDEVAELINATNGQYPDRSFIQQMIGMFNSLVANTINAANNGDADKLTREAFLAFYLKQTLEDPSETRNDLEKFGYDSKLLIQRDVSPPA